MERLGITLLVVLAMGGFIMAVSGLAMLGVRLVGSPLGAMLPGAVALFYFAWGVAGMYSNKEPPAP